MGEKIKRAQTHRRRSFGLFVYTQYRFINTGNKGPRVMKPQAKEFSYAACALEM